MGRSADYRRIRPRIWYIPIFLLMPTCYVLAYGLMSLTGAPLPVPHISVLEAPVLFFVFFVAALGEELGWSGYAIDRLQAHRSAFGASILLGTVCAVWHVVPLLQVGRSPQWIGWWCLYTIAGRVLFTWLYNNTGKSVFGAAVFHATSNTSWQLFPNHGSHYDPQYTGFIVAFAAAIVTIVWGPQTLAQSAHCRAT